MGPAVPVETPKTPCDCEETPEPSKPAPPSPPAQTPTFTVVPSPPPAAPPAPAPPAPAPPAYTPKPEPAPAPPAYTPKPVTPSVSTTSRAPLQVTANAAVENVAPWSAAAAGLVAVLGFIAV